jgi:hypothetical protein
MRVSLLIVQTLYITMVDFLSKLEPWSNCNGSCNKLIWAQFWINSVWFGILWIIQNPWWFRRHCNTKKCYKLDFLPPQYFPDFYSFCRYFSCALNPFSGCKLNPLPLTCGAYLSATFSSCMGPLVGAFLPPGSHAACRALPITELSVQRGWSWLEPVRSLHPPCRSRAASELAGDECCHHAKCQHQPPSHLPPLLLCVQVAKSSPESRNAAFPSVAVDACSKATAPLVVYDASRAAVHWPVSGLNRRLECFVQTSTLASSPIRPDPFPSCHHDRVRVHLL